MTSPSPTPPASPSLGGRTVLVTGGNGGIGLAMAVACGRAGARVGVWGRDAAKNDAALAAVRAESIEAHALVCDIGDAGYAWDRFREATTARTPVRRWADPSEMGAAAVFLAAPTTTFHTGDTVTVDGGYTVF